RRRSGTCQRDSNACLHILFSVMYVSVIVFLRYRLTSNVVAALSVPRLKEILVTLKFTLNSLYKFLIIRGKIGRASCRKRWMYMWVMDAEDGIRDRNVTGVQTCALPIFNAIRMPVFISFSPLCMYLSSCF